MKFKWKFLQPKYWLIWFICGLTWVLSLLPYKALLNIGKLLGWLIFKIAKRRRYIATTNISMCFKDLTLEQQQQLVRNHFFSVGIGVIEVIISWWWSNSRLKKLITCHDIENLLQAHNDSGVLLMVMHNTTIELAGKAVANYFSLSAVYRKHDNELYEYLQSKFRNNHDHKGRMIDKNDIRNMIKTLRKKNILWYAPDQDYGSEHSVFVPFFGIKKVATINTTAKLASIGKAKVVPMSFTRKHNNDGYNLRFHPELKLNDNFNTGENEIKINNFIETVVRQHPDQYMWLHRRFKTRPPGEAKIY
jgi:KDO2-lipid IV(A) lauroyltransferase